VNPFAIANDATNTVKLVIDGSLAKAGDKKILFHPMINTETVAITYATLEKFFASKGRKADFVIDFAAQGAGAPAAAAGDAAAGGYSGGEKTSKPKAAADESKPKAAAAAASAPAGGIDRSKFGKGEGLGVTVKRSEDLALWYKETLEKSECLEYYEGVSGCYILRPWSFFMWKVISTWFDEKISNMGVEPCYFPMFVPKSALEKEKAHIEGFAPEVAWVTKSGEEDLPEPIALRPTSETVMYPYYSKWIRSHRDLPLRLNQWCNVVRWEFSHPTPFIRTREFLWQEGHTAWATKAEAEEEVLQILSLYSQVYETLLAVPTIVGTKTEKEKFAGGEYTTTCETFIPEAGRGCQGATSHLLGTHFAEMFDITYLDDENTAQRVWQNSWGLTTRSLGVMVMVHGDDKGLVLPPKIAKVQVVIVPCGIKANTTAEQKDQLLAGTKKLEKALRAAGVRVFTEDYDPRKGTGFRFAHWEVRGVPLRVEFGFGELSSGEISVVRRMDNKYYPDQDKKVYKVANDDNVGGAIVAMLDQVQTEMLQKATEERDRHVLVVDQWADFVPSLNRKCALISPWCGARACEDEIKKRSAEESVKLLAEYDADEKAPSMGAKSLCVPHKQPSADIASKVCILCQQPAKTYCMFGRSY